MKFVIGFICVGLLMLSSCSNSNNNEGVILEKIGFDDLDNEVETYINMYIQDNGVYLIRTEEMQYLFLSNRSVATGEEAGYFSNVHAEISEDKLMIYFDENFVEDYNDERLEDNMVIYQIHDNDDYDYILAHKNGIEVPFDNIYGI